MKENGRAQWLNWFFIAALVYTLLIAVNIVGKGFGMATAEGATALFEFASNPLIALIIGTVATAALQSSSTATSVIVGMVAGGLPLSIAIPMIMGANIGTSLTSTLVSLGHIRNEGEFQRAFSAATVHDSFNFLAVAILFPIEVLFSPMEKLSFLLVGLIPADAAANLDVSLMGAILSPVVNTIVNIPSFLPDVAAGVSLIITGIVMILGVVTFLSKLLKRVMVGRALALMQNTVGRGPMSGIGAGAAITVMVQSSTTTTSLIVPMAGSGVFSLRQVYPFTLGANVGTTITAIIAATAIVGPTAVLAMQIAAIHLLFNLFAIGIIYGLPVLREIPIKMANGLAALAHRNKLYVLGYIGGVFFVFPLTALGITQLF